MLEMRHNLVTLLYTIKGFSEAHLCRFEEGLFRDNDDALAHAQDVMKRIYSQTEKALLITKKIGLAMKMSQKAEGDLDQTSIKDIWGDVTEILHRQRPSGTCIEFIDHVPEEFPKILCDRNELTEILYCLADNAMQAMEGKGKLIIRTSLGFRAGEDPIASITVADTGPGMPEETLNRLFEPFMTTKAADKGNGLGLCLVKGLVRKNGGSISVSSFKGCGTTFTMTFLVAKAKDRKEDFTLVS